MFQVPIATARCLLEHFKWDKEHLFERYFATDRKKLFASAMCVDPADNPKTAPAAAAEIECEICLDPFTCKDMIPMPCGHLFCRTCVQGYLHFAITSSGLASIECPMAGC